MRKKFLSLILALCMVLSLLPMTAFAAAPGSDLTITAAAFDPAEKDKVKLTITAGDGSALDASTQVKYLVVDDADKATSIPDDENGWTNWTDAVVYAVDSGKDFATVEATDGQYIVAAYVNNDDKTIKSGATATGVNDGYTEATKVELDQATLTLTLGGDDASSKLTATATPNNASGSVAWESSATSIATVDQQGNVTAVAKGEATITATIDDVSATCTVTVNEASTAEKTPLTKDMFTVDTSDKPYTGSAITPTVTVKNTADPKPMASTDFDVTYANNENVGQATITITAKGDTFSGTLTYNFNITQKTISVTSATVADKVYDGTTAGTVSAVVFDGATLTLGTDYTATATFTKATVDTEISANVTVTLIGDAAKNYTLGDNNTATATADITAKAITGSVTITYPADTTTIGENTVLTANTDGLIGIVGNDEVTYTYQWQKDGADVADATGKTYTIGNASTDASGAKFTVNVKVDTSASPNYTCNDTAFTCANEVAVGATAITGVVSIALTDADTGILTATVPDALLTGDEGAKTLATGLKFQWLFDGATPTDGTGFTYTLVPGNAGKAITATVVPAETSTYTGSIVSASKTFDVPSAPTVTGSVTQESTEAGNDGKITISWTVPASTDGLAITGYSVQKAGSSAENVDKTVTSKVFEGLDTTESITFTVIAKNMLGNSVAGTYTYTPTGGGEEPTPTPPGGGGSGGGSGTTPTPPPVDPDPNPPTGDDVTQTVTPDVSEGTASATVDKETADKLVSDAVDNNSANVTVKVDVPADADVNEVKADIPASAVADLASKTDANLTVETPMGNVTIPNETLSQLGGSSGNVTVTTAVNEDNSVKVEVQTNGTTVGSLNGGMKVDLPVSQPTAGTVAVLVDANGNETVLPKSAVNGSEVAVLLENGSATIKFVDNAQSFADTDNHWAKNSIAFVSSRNLFQGMENNNFKADVPMNRAMLVTVLHRLESTPAAGSVSFDDVPADSYYATAAAWAAGKGIVTGDASGFSGDRSVTREEMAVMLYRYVQTINGNKGTLGSFSGMGGASDVSSWANQAMRWAVGSGIINGDANNNLNPGSTATRGEVSQMLMNFVKLITK